MLEDSSWRPVERLTDRADVFDRQGVGLGKQGPCKGAQGVCVAR